MIVHFRNEKVSNHGSIPITIDCNVVAFIVFEEGFHQPIKRTKDENASQVAEIANDVYGADTVTANYVQFWFRRFRSGIFDVKEAPRRDRPVVGNVDKIKEIIGIDHHIRVVASPRT
ncbi:histone-lysine N-methyltransferase SETMAR [Trichonephila clavipes]|nr:histone-lysine N-methyltransferase SETMAR [Trichonephila clavipes]